LDRIHRRIGLRDIYFQPLLSKSKVPTVPSLIIFWLLLFTLWTCGILLIAAGIDFASDDGLGLIPLLLIADGLLCFSLPWTDQADAQWSNWFVIVCAACGAMVVIAGIVSSAAIALAEMALAGLSLWIKHFIEVRSRKTS
jgi:hypothetical protein